VIALLLALLTFAPAQAADCFGAYEAGEYADAATCFEELELAGNHNGHLLYDTGNAWYRAGDVGRAVLSYRRALLFLPRHGDVRANLVSARGQSRDDLPPPDVRGPLGRTLLSPYDALSRSELLLLGAFGWALLMTGLALRLGRGVDLPLPALVAAGILAGGGLIGWAARSYTLSAHPVGVVLDEEVTLRSGRDLQSVDLARLHAGAELAVVEQAERWIQVSLSTGQRGWLPAGSVGLVQELPDPALR